MTNTIKRMLEGAKSDASRRVGVTEKCYVEIADFPVNKIITFMDYKYNPNDGSIVAKEIDKLKKICKGDYLAEELDQIHGTDSSAMMDQIHSALRKIAANRLLEEALK